MPCTLYFKGNKKVNDVLKKELSGKASKTRKITKNVERKRVNAHRQNLRPKNDWNI